MDKQNENLSEDISGARSSTLSNCTSRKDTCTSTAETASIESSSESTGREVKTSVPPNVSRTRPLNCNETSEEDKNMYSQERLSHHSLRIDGPLIGVFGDEFMYKSFTRLLGKEAADYYAAAFGWQVNNDGAD